MPRKSTKPVTTDGTAEAPKVKRQWSQEAKERNAKRRAEIKQLADHMEYMIEQQAMEEYYKMVDSHAVIIPNSKT